MTTLDGFFEGPDHDISWHHVDGEFGLFAEKQMREADTILFGRRTYQLMEEFWPSQAGLSDDPVVAELMNTTPKIVVSKTLKNVTETKHWKQVTLLHKVDAEYFHNLKKQPGKAIIVLASSNLCLSLLKLGLLDEVRVMINPVVIGRGTPLFAGSKHKISLTLEKSRTFGNGNILLYYKPDKHISAKNK